GPCGTNPMPVTVNVRGPAAPASRTTEPVAACNSLAVVGASTISSAAAGIRPPVSTTGTRLPPTAVEVKLSTETWPDCAPPTSASSTPVTSGSAAAARRTRPAAGVKSCPDRPRNVSSCQVWPKRAGLAAASDTPAANVKAASTPSTPATAPSKAGRTGTADRPRPGSSANLAPTTTGTPNPAAAAAAATADRRGTARRRRGSSARAAVAADPAATRTGARTQPGPRISQSALMPGCGSWYDAAAIGIQREATRAAATPSVDPAAAASSGGAVADATAWSGVMPTACRTCRSATVAEVYLATDWPIRNSAATSAASAKANRQAASYRVIRSMAPPKN